jgi:hypothetical protein
MIDAMFRTRWRAAATYLVGSIAIAAACFALIYAVWYPLGLFAPLGGLELLALISVVELVIGPGLIAIVFKPGKKGLLFDVAVIAALQAGALTYGLHVLYVSRPAYIVFVKDRFEMIRAIEVPEQELAKAKRYNDIPLDGPRIVGARVPQDPQERTRVMFAAIGGVDLHYFPQHYVDYDEVRKDVIAHAAPIAKLKLLNPDARGEIDRIVAATGRAEDQLDFLPMKSRKRDLAVIVDGKTGDVLHIAALKPWR